MRMNAAAESPVPVTFLLEDLDFGGTQRQTLELASRLDRRRFTPRLVTLRAGSGDLAAQAASLKLPWHSLTQERGEISLASALPALWRYLANERPPLLQLLTVLPNIWGRVFGRCLGLPGIIGCCRGEAAVKGQHERFLSFIPHAHIGNARIIRQRLVNEARVPVERCHFIPNGVDTSRFSPAEEKTGAPSVLCVARFAPVKNHRLLLEAFARVCEGLPEARLHLVGEGECTADLMELAQAQPLKGKVHFHPPDTDVPRLLRQAHVFALASNYEGTPNAILEAMACALPVVATRTGGNVEAVSHEKSGLLVPVGDAPAMAHALTRLLKDAGLRRTFGQEGRKRAVGNYSMQVMVAAHEAVYDAVLRKKRRA